MPSVEPGHGLQYTPGQAVWGFFIPFVNIVRPVQCAAIASSCERSERPSRATRAARVPNVSYRQNPLVDAPKWSAPRVPVGLWWGAYMGSILVPIVVTMSNLPGGVHAIQESASGIGFQVATLISIVASGLGAVVVYGIDKNQIDAAGVCGRSAPKGRGATATEDAERSPENRAARSSASRAAQSGGTRAARCVRSIAHDILQSRVGRSALLRPKRRPPRTKDSWRPFGFYAIERAAAACAPVWFGAAANARRPSIVQ